MPIEIPYLDGERIPFDKLGRIFRNPPGVAQDFARNTLIVGSRGSGKTTLFKHLLKMSPQETIYLSLFEELGNLAKDAVDIQFSHSKRLEEVELLTMRSECLLTIAVLREAYKRLKTLNMDDFVGFLPELLRPKASESFSDWLDRMPNGSFETIQKDNQYFKNNGLIERVLTVLGNKFGNSGLRLKILFDRADGVPMVIVYPILGLLDQHGSYIIVVATRPSPNGNFNWGKHPLIIPYDHYDVIHMGDYPREENWRIFLKEAVGAQLPEVLKEAFMPSRVLDTVIYIARDSIRLALELTYHSIHAPGSNWIEKINNTILGFKDKLIQRVGARVKPLDFRKIVNKWLETIENKIQRIEFNIPIAFEIVEKGSKSLFTNLNKITELDSFIATCLEDSVLNTLPGNGWYPGKFIREVELAPCLLWKSDKEVLLKSIGEMEKIKISPSKFMNITGFYGLKRGKIFVGLRFKNSKSLQFFERLKEALASNPMLVKIALRHGKLPLGKTWASDIRKLIKDCTLLTIGDVTGLRGDVLFELGIAYALKRPIIPVVESIDFLDDCPYWIKEVNVGSYESLGTLEEIIGSIHEHLYGEEKIKPAEIPTPVPNLAAFVGKSDWNKHCIDQIMYMVKRDGIKFDGVDSVNISNYANALNLTAKARMLIFSVDGTDKDAFIHFGCGMVMGHDYAGFGPKKLNRKVVIIRESDSIAIPESIFRCQNNIYISSSPDEALNLVRDIIHEYISWSQNMD